MRAELIFTGTEILLGEINNTHAEYLGQKLSALGVEVILHTTVGDNWQQMADILNRSLVRSDLIIITGGLGPTTDDLTKETVADVLGLPMFMDDATLKDLEDFFARRGAVMPESIRKQAFFPAGAQILPNPVGTASGMLIERGNNILVLLPGPPNELRAICENSLLPFLSTRSNQGEQLRSLTIKLTGISESEVQDRLQDLDRQSNPGIAYLAMPGEVHIRVFAKDKDGSHAEQMVHDLAQRVRVRVEEYVFGFDGDILEEVVSKYLAQQRVTIALAESCTGGLVTKRLTDIPGSSSYMLGAVVAYANQVKERMIGVPPPILSFYGAVSDQAATAMARGVRLVFASDIGLAITGIAGPTGGEPEKPVGTVHIALDTSRQTFHKKFLFPGRRAAVRQGAANAALHILCKYLKKLL